MSKRIGQNNIRIEQSQEPIPPIELIHSYSLNDSGINFIKHSREVIADIISGKDKRLLVIIGPCSIHDKDSAIDYANRLTKLKDKLKDELFIVMRVYFEKPRTTIGWKGLIYDPDLDESFDIDKGLTMSRSLLIDIAKIGLPAATEYLDLITPQYFADLISWGAIGARTTESQTHRELASGLSCPVGFKNATNGNVSVAIDAIISASYSHMFWSISKKGLLRRYKTKGNKKCHLILRGGEEPNYSAKDVSNTCLKMVKNNLAPRLMIDCSHGNSQKEFKNQLKVIDSISAQITSGSHSIFGVMLESNIKEGNQKITSKDKLKYGVSITDACLGFEDSEGALQTLASAIKTRNLQNNFSNE